MFAYGSKLVLHLFFFFTLVVQSIAFQLEVEASHTSGIHSSSVSNNYKEEG